MKTVHIIFHAHLDPIWLWRWEAGLDEALNTCRSACDRLDANPDAIFTQGEAWVYDMVARTDPKLFARIREHVAEERWVLTGGWWIQPDCNIPGELGFRKQIEAGKNYFEKHFGTFPQTAFNVDSFGHSAVLPRLMREAGQKYYVMMRPQEQEMDLPARMFRWRGEADGDEVLCFRIAGSYNSRELTEEHVRRSLEALPDGVKQTMCFAGIGDHGGGPTEKLIRWVRNHEYAFPGIRLIFSSPERFFSELEAEREKLPLVVGELQHHAVGCYTVHRPVKLGCRQGEQRLRQAEIALEADPAPDAGSKEKLEEAWKAICFHQFHDTLGGTCLPSAYRYVDGQLAGADALADEIMHLSLRRQLQELPDCPDQQLVVFNPSDNEFSGILEFEPWMETRKVGEKLKLFDGKQQLPMQRMHLEALTHRPPPGRIAFPLQLGAGELRALRLAEVEENQLDTKECHFSPDNIDNTSGSAVSLKNDIMRINGQDFSLPELHLIADDTDTWSHGIDRYGEEGETARWDTPHLLESGTLLAEIAQEGNVGSSHLLRQFRVYRGQPLVELRLRIDWNERNQVLKLVLPLTEASADSREDGIAGQSVRRAQDGAERPLRDWTRVEINDGFLGVVSPQVFALDGTAERLRWTLLRSPQAAWHNPHPGGRSSGRYLDRGEHDFLFRFYFGNNLDAEQLESFASCLNYPPILADLTRGMPPFE